MSSYIKHKLFAPLLILLVGLIVTYVLVHALALSHQQKSLETFRFDIDRRANAIQTLVTKDIELIGSAANFYFASNSEQWHHFEDFAPYVLSRSETLIALEWLEHIPAESLDLRIKEIQEHLPNFQIYTVLDKEVIKGPPLKSQSSFILTDVMPKTDINLGLLGFYSSQERFQYILRQAQTSGNAVISDKVRLLQDGTNAAIEKNGILVYHPVFESTGTSLKGIVIGVIRISSYIDTLLDVFNREENINIQIRDTGFESEDDATLYTDLNWQVSESSIIRNIYLPNRVWEAHFSFTHISTSEQIMSRLLIGLAGALITLTLSALFYYLNNERLIVGRMLTERTKDLEIIAYKDPLTGLANRRKFDTDLKERIKKAEPFGFFVIDFDDFKKINDLHGHSGGDKTLIAVSDAIKGLLKNSELLARVGGDEMIILCQAHNMVQMKEKGATICKLVSEMRLIESGKVIKPKLSVGGALWQPSLNAEQLHKMADNALYKAKSSGKNRYIIAPIANPNLLSVALHSI